MTMTLHGSGRRDAADQIALVAAHLYVVSYLLIWLWEPFSQVRGVPGVARYGLLPALGIMAVVLGSPDRLRRVRMPALIAVYIAWALLSLSWTSEWDNGLLVIKGELLALALIGLVASTIEPAALTRTLLFSFVAIGLVSLLHVITSPGARSRMVGEQFDILQVGWKAGFASKNFLGMFAVLGVGLVLAFVTDRRMQIPLGGMFVLLAIGSRSATAAAALIVTAVTWSLLTWMAPLIGRVRRAGTTVVVGAAAGLALAIAALAPAILWLYGKDSTLSERTVIWSETWRFIGEEPLIGHGIGAVWFRPTDPLSVLLDGRIGFRSFHAHNGALDIWLSLGIVGVAVIAAFLVQIALLARRAVLAGGESLAYGRWAVTTLAGMGTMAIVEPVLRQGALGYLVMVWVVLAGVSTSTSRTGGGPSSSHHQELTT